MFFIGTSTMMAQTLSRQHTKPSDGYIYGHEYVDLGLSVKWATCNVGASSPEDYGDYFAWGEIKPAPGLNYTEENCKTYNKSMGSIAGDPQYDAARANWGGTWRLPTNAEIVELVNNCNTEWTTLNGVKGYKVTSKKNGKSIFLPAGGWRNGTLLNNVGGIGFYWSASPYESDTGYTYSLNFNSDNFSSYWNFRNIGQSVRPVSE